MMVVEFSTMTMVMLLAIGVFLAGLLMFFTLLVKFYHCDSGVYGGYAGSVVWSFVVLAAYVLLFTCIVLLHLYDIGEQQFLHQQLSQPPAIIQMPAEPARVPPVRRQRAMPTA